MQKQYQLKQNVALNFQRAFNGRWLNFAKARGNKLRYTIFSFAISAAAAFLWLLRQTLFCSQGWNNSCFKVVVSDVCHLWYRLSPTQLETLFDVIFGQNIGHVGTREKWAQRVSYRQPTLFLLFLRRTQWMLIEIMWQLQLLMIDRFLYKGAQTALNIKNSVSKYCFCFIRHFLPLNSPRAWRKFSLKEYVQECRKAVLLLQP